MAAPVARGPVTGRAPLTGEPFYLYDSAGAMTIAHLVEVTVHPEPHRLRAILAVVPGAQRRGTERRLVSRGSLDRRPHADPSHAIGDPCAPGVVSRGFQSAAKRARERVT
jgi:hypothetical protein